MITLPIFTLMLVAEVCQAAQPTPTSTPRANDTARVQSEVLTAREEFSAELLALKPEDPEAYILLAEDIADAARSPEDTRLSIELYALGFEAARNSAGTTPRAALMSTACRGLASLVNYNPDRRWLQSLATFVDPLAQPPLWTTRPPPTNPESYAYRVSLFLGYTRAGYGSLAQQMLSKPDFAQTLTAMQPILARSGVTGGIVTLQRWASAWPCRTCSGAGITRRGNPPEFTPCSNCNGKPGPRLSQADLVAQLRLEGSLLQGFSPSWSAQLNSDDGAPLQEPDPSQLCPRLKVDPTRMYFRSGAWVLRADGTNTPDPGPGLPELSSSTEGTPASVGP
jgi:hypothetical protein